MKIFTIVALIGVFLIVMLMIACNGGNDVESNVGKLTEGAFTEVEIEDGKDTQGSIQVEQTIVNGEITSNNEEETVKEANFSDEVDSSKTKLQKFFGRWETEEHNSADMIVLEMGTEGPDDITNSKETFEYIRFGYEASGFFPREKVIELEKHGSKNAYYITISYIEENNENDGWTVVETEEVTKYLIELVEENKMLLTYTNDEVEREFFFHKK